MNRAALGRRIKKARNDRSLTSEQLSEAVDMNPVFIRQIEAPNSDKLPSVPALVDIRNALKVSMEYLLQDSLEPLPEEEKDEIQKFIARLERLSPKQQTMVLRTGNTMIDEIEE